MIPGVAAIALAGAVLLGFSRGPAGAEEPAPNRVEPVTIDGKVATGPYAPKDECAYLPGFAAFRSALSAAIDARDADQLIALSHPGIDLDTNGGAGIDEFRRRLDADDTLWTELSAIEPLGCASEGGQNAVMPWIAAQASRDETATYWTVGDHVAVRSAASAQSSVIEKVAYDLIEAEPGSETNGFRKVVAKTGATSGYVANADLRPVDGYRLSFVRATNGWMIDAFLTES